MKNKILKFLSLLTIATTIFGCKNDKKEESGRRYSYVVYDVYNTSVTLHMYDKNELDNFFPSFSSLAKSLHKEMDRDNYYEDLVNLKSINDSYGTNIPVIVSKEMIEVLKMSITMAELTNGYFNPATGTIIDVWTPLMDPIYDDAENEYIYDRQDPRETTIETALTCVPTVEELKNILIIDETNNAVTFKRLDRCDNKVLISLGGIGKGYAMDKLRELYESQYNDPALIDGGTSSLHMIGKNPISRTVNGVKGNYWVIAPTGPRQFQYENLLYYARKDSATVSTSGNATKYFNLLDSNGEPVYDEYGQRVIRTHIINPFTGISEQYYDSITVVSNIDAGVLDALTTALYSIKDLDVIKNIIEAVEDYYDIEIDYCLSKLIKENDESKILVYMGQSYKDKAYNFNDRIKDIIIF